MSTRVLGFVWFTVVLLGTADARAQAAAPPPPPPTLMADEPAPPPPPPAASPAAEPAAPAVVDPAQPAPPAFAEPPPSASAAEAEEVNPFLVFGAAYGAGVGVNAIYFAIDLCQRLISTVAAFNPALVGVTSPVTCLTSIAGLGLCFVLPGAQGAAITAAGDLVGGRSPSMAYLWTILASYGSCYAGGCAASLLQFGVGCAILGPTFLAIATGGLGAGGRVPTVEPWQTVAIAASGIGITGAFLVLQPLVPAGVYVLTRGPVAGPEGGKTTAGSQPAPTRLAQAMPY